MSGVESIILFVPISLLVGGILRTVNKSTNIPYAPMLLILGLIWGYFDIYIGTIGEVAIIVSSMEPVRFT